MGCVFISECGPATVQFNPKPLLKDQHCPPRPKTDRRPLWDMGDLNMHWMIKKFCRAAALSVAITAAVPSQAAEDGFVSIFDGKTLEGWHVSAKTGHSRASQHTSGGRWVVEEGALVGSQDVPGNGGIIITDKKFTDFEVVLEMNNDFGPDSGLFLRSDEEGTAFQAMIDYHARGNLMGLYGEGKLGARPSVRSFSFDGDVTRIQPVTNAFTALPVLPQSWPHFWRHGQWNELRARIVGNPPTITTWINGVKFMDWTDPLPKRHPDSGGIALQVHGGGDWTRHYVRYRNIRVKPLDEPATSGTEP
jgi:hypothetical protein